jgi:hypothetical protein
LVLAVAALQGSNGGCDDVCWLVLVVVGFGVVVGRWGGWLGLVFVVAASQGFNGRCDDVCWLVFVVVALQGFNGGCDDLR